MPLSEYTCLLCGKRFDKFEENVAEETVACPVCGATEVRKEISPFPPTGSASSPACTPGG